MAAIDLRGQGIDAAIVVLPRRETALPKGFIDLGDDPAARLGARRTALGSRLGLTLSSTDTLGTALLQRMSGQLRPVRQPDGRERYQIVCAGHVLADAPTIHGGATDDFDYPNGGLEAVSGGAWSSGGLDGTVNVVGHEVVFLDGFEWRAVIRNLNLGSPDHFSRGRCRYNAASSDFSLGPIVRNQTGVGGEPFSGSKYVSFVDNQNGAGVYAVASSSPSLILQDDASFDDDSIVELGANGSTIALDRDSVELLSTTNTAVSTGNYAGFFMQRFNGGGTTNIWFSAWVGALFSAPATDLAPADAGHAHGAESPTLTQVHIIVVADAGHAHAVDSPTLTQLHELAPADTGHAQKADAPTLAQLHELAPADGAHAQTADALALTQLHQLAAADTTHATAADDAEVDVGAIDLEPADATHDHTTEAPTLAQMHVVAVDDAGHQHTADSIVLAQAHTLAVADAAHAQPADAVVLAQTHTIAIDDVMHVHLADAPTFAQTHTLAVADTTHGHAAEAISLSSAGDIVVDDTTHGHGADSPALAQLHQLAVADAAHAHHADVAGMVQAHVLVVADAGHAHGAEFVALEHIHIVVVADAAHAHPSDTPTITQLHLLSIDDADHAQLADIVAMTASVAAAMASTGRVTATVTIGAVSGPTSTRTSP